MRLAGKRLLLLIMDGVDQEEYQELKKGFEEENAQIFVTTPQEYLTVETVCQGRRGKDILVDLPFEAIFELRFDGLVVPDGLLSTDLLKRNERVLQLIADFHQRALPIFASGNSVRLLYESGVLSEQILVREGTAIETFLDQAVSILLDRPEPERSYRAMYRPTMSA